MSVTNSTNMNLPVPVVGSESGPQYATDINSCMTLIDAHDHTPGNGVQIGAGGLNIQSDLALNGSNLTLARSVRMSAQSGVIAGASDLGCIYNVSGDLYYNDGSGNQIRMTQSGSIAGAAGSISGLTSPASATYIPASTKFVWQSGVNLAADLDARSLILRNSGASSSGLTLSAPTLSGDISMTLPSLPGSTLPMQISSAGVMSAAQIPTAGIATAAVTQAKVEIRSTGTTVGAGGVAISASSGAFTTTGTTLTDVTNLSVTITTLGNPIEIRLIPDGTLNPFDSFVGASVTSSIVVADATFVWFVDGSAIANNYILATFPSASSNNRVYQPPGVLTHVYPVAAGSHTIKLQAAGRTSANNKAEVQYCKLMVREIK